MSRTQGQCLQALCGLSALGAVVLPVMFMWEGGWVQVVVRVLWFIASLVGFHFAQKVTPKA